LRIGNAGHHSGATFVGRQVGFENFKVAVSIGNLLQTITTSCHQHTRNTGLSQ
jgi:hypothetical protein